MRSTKKKSKRKVNVTQKRWKRKRKMQQKWHARISVFLLCVAGWLAVGEALVKHHPPRSSSSIHHYDSCLRALSSFLQTIPFSLLRLRYSRSKLDMSCPFPSTRLQRYPRSPLPRALRRPLLHFLLLGGLERRLAHAEVKRDVAGLVAGGAGGGGSAAGGGGGGGAAGGAGALAAFGGGLLRGGGCCDGEACLDGWGKRGKVSCRSSSTSRTQRTSASSSSSTATSIASSCAAACAAWSHSGQE